MHRGIEGPQNQQTAAVQRNGLYIMNGDTLESLGKFCYLNNMLNADGGVDSAVVARVRCAWKKFRELIWKVMLEGGRLYETHALPGAPPGILPRMSRPLNDVCVFIQIIKFITGSPILYSK